MALKLNATGVTVLAIVLTIALLLHTPLTDNPLEHLATVNHESMWFALGHVTQSQYIYQVLKILWVKRSDIAHICLDAITVVERSEKVCKHARTAAITLRPHDAMLKAIRTLMNRRFTHLFSSLP